MLLIILTGLFMLLSGWLIGFVVRFRRQITSMVGMMSAMTLGMTLGLAMGSIMALWLPGQFFQSTVISMLVGGIAGVIIGWPISLMAIMDGLLSGIMGGMMGAMLMFMMPVTYAAVTIKILSILCSSILFLLLIMLQGQMKAEHLRQTSFLFAKPVMMFIVILIVLAFGLRMPLHSPVSNPGHHHAASTETFRVTATTQAKKP